MKKTILNITEYLKGLHFRVLARNISGSRYANSPPSPQNAINIFYGDWISKFPDTLGATVAGQIELFSDERIHWFINETGGLEGKTVLELGPLEGMHSHLLEASGAKSITAVESDTRAFLKCLVTKELLDLSRVRFLCGDFIEYLRDDRSPHFDACIASGVLYHMINPAELISLIAKHCDQYLFLWTHYYDAEIIEANQQLSRRFSKPIAVNHQGFDYSICTRNYLESAGTGTFCGASGTKSSWMTKDDLFRCLKFFGFEIFRVWFDEPLHENGPSIAVIASRV